jgi:tetratricopeptide (TPR) repeat protein
MTPVATSVTLTGVNHAAQTWNNCGPTTIAMNLSYFGLNMHQREAAAFLKPNADDKNVSPEQLAAFAEGEGYKVRIGVGGDLSLLRRLLSNGFPVIVETWILPEDLGGMGHYRLLTGFDDVAQTFTAQDSYFGPDEVIGARALDEEWRVFNHKYLVLYRPEQEEFLMGVLGVAGDDEQMLAVTLAEAQRAAAANPQDAFAWFNLGSAYTWTGEFETAATAFDEARRLGLPLRMFWYQFELFDAYMAVGRFEEVAQLAYATAYSASGHEEAYYYQGMAYRALGREDVAVSNLRKAVDYNPNFEPAIAALSE